MSSETPNNNITNNENNSVIGVLKDDVAQLVTGVKDIAVESIATVKSPETQSAISGTTSGIVGAAATTLNTIGKAIDTNPEMLQVVGEISKDGAEILHEMKPVLQEASNQMIESGSETAGALAKSGVNVAVNAASAIPGLGAAIAFGKIANNIGDAASAVVKGMTSFSQIGSKVAADVNNRLDRIRNKSQSIPMTGQMKVGGARVARKTRREKKQLERRINKSLRSFYNPLSTTKKLRRGSKKRRRK
jgi:hypothetical protein